MSRARRPAPPAARALLTLLVGISATPGRAAPADEAAPTSPGVTTTDDAPSAVRIAWSGGSGGIDAGTFTFRLHQRLGEAGAPALADVRSSHAWLVHGPWMVAADDRTLASTLAVFGGATPACVAPRPATALRTPDEIAIFDDEPPTWTAFWPAERAPATWWTCQAGATTADLIGPRGADPASIPWALGAWELRLSLAWTLAPPEGAADAVSLRVPVIGRPRDDGPRRARQISEIVQDGVLFVDAGRFVPGLSAARDDRLSLNRPAAMALLRRVGAAALAPGLEELVAGPKALLAEAGDLPWVATNWQTRDEALAIPPSRIVQVQTYGRTARVAFLGALDPDLQGRIPAIVADGVTLADPVQAIQEHVDRLRAQTPPPDLIVVLSTSGPAVQSRLRRELRGVDLLLGDASDTLEGVSTMELRLEPGRRGAAPISLPGRPLILAEVVVAPSGGASAMFVRPLPVDLDDPPDAEVLRHVTLARAETFPGLDRPLLPAPSGPPGSVLGDAAFARVVCEAVREVSRADIVFLPDLPASDPVPGPHTRLLAAQRLRMTDRLERHLVPGDRLGRLLDQLYQSPMVACGTTLGSRSLAVAGRGIEPDQMYRIVTTDRMRQASALGALLDGARNPAALGGKGYDILRDAAGQPRTLRGAALEALDALAEEHGDAVVTELLARRTAKPQPRWMLRLRNLSLRLEGFQGADDPAYAQVPETLATSPSSLTLGTAADLALHYDESRVAWDARLRHAYTRLRTAALVQETADDLRLSSSVTLPGATTPPILGLAVRPFGEGLLDSEWTPIVSADGSELPRQLDLSFTLGLAAQPKKYLRALRLGVIGMQDLSRTDKRANLGSRAEIETLVPFGPGLRWASQLNAIAYLNTPDQDARDLRFRALLDTRVALPLLRGLDVAFYGNLFLFQGRVPETSAVRRSFTLGASLDARGAFKLTR